MACCTVPRAEKQCYVTLKNSDSITAWNVIINNADNLNEISFGSISYCIANVRGTGGIEVYLDMTGSAPISVLNLNELFEKQ